MVKITVDEIQQYLSDYLEQVKAGETVVLLEAGQPVAEIKPVMRNGTELRPFGLCTGQFHVPDDFDTPLPEDLLERFEGR